MKPSQLTDEQLEQVIVEGSKSLDLEYEPYTLGKFSDCLCERLWEKSLEGWEDDSTGSTEWDVHASLLGRFIVYSDDRGFVDYEEFESTALAMAHFETIDAAYGEWLDATDVPF